MDQITAKCKGKNMWLIYALMAAITWGLNYSLDEKIFKHQISPLTLLAAQAWAGAILFTGLAYVFRLKEDVATISQNRTIQYILLAGLAAATLGNFFIAISIQAKNATFAALIEESYPLFTILFSFLLFKDNYLTPGVIIGGGLIIMGVGVISLLK